MNPEDSDPKFRAGDIVKISEEHEEIMSYLLGDALGKCGLVVEVVETTDAPVILQWDEAGDHYGVWPDGAEQVISVLLETGRVEVFHSTELELVTR